MKRFFCSPTVLALLLFDLVLLDEGDQGMDRSISSRTIEDLGPGEHLCCIYGTDQEQRDVIVPFVQSGIERGEKVVYICDDTSTERATSLLGSGGWDVRPYVAREQLVIHTAQETYLREGRFDPARMIALLRAETDAARASGYEVLRVTGEMTWATRGDSGSERLIEYEALLNRFFPTSSCLAICQYDRRRFEPDTLMDVLFTHPTVVLGTEIFENLYYLPPEAVLEDLPGARFEYWTQALASHSMRLHELRASEERYRLLFERNLAGVYRRTLDGVLLDCNDAFARMLGYASREEALALGTSDYYFDSGNRAEFVAALQAAGSVTNREFRARRKDGTPVVLLKNAALVADPSGALTLVEGTVYDITEHKRVEDELREREATLSQAQRIANLGHWDWRIATGELKWSHQIYRIFGVDPEGFEPTYDAFLAMVHPDDRDRIRRAVAAAVESHSLYDVQHRIIRPDGAVRIVHEAGEVSAEGEDRPAQMLGVVQDVTEAKQVEEYLLQAQKTEALGRLAGGVAHDFNNILQAMLATVQLWRAEAEGAATAAAGELEDQIRRGAALVRQLLLFARRGLTKPERLDLNELISGAIGFLKRLLRDNVRLHVELCPDVLPVDVDRGQIEQVLANLVVNAAHAMPDGGELRVRTIARNAGEVAFEVADTGTGIGDEIRGRLFEPFFTTKEDKGSGLGLAVVQGIVSQHGGKVEVESTPGRGSTFRIVLPRRGSASLPRVADELQARKAPTAGEERVLLVEDDPEIRRLLLQILQSLGYEVVAAGTGEEAGTLPTEPAFDLLITDVSLPGIAGPELARGLRDRWPSLKVIVMSGYAEGEVLREDIANGSVRFLQKPIDFETLAHEIRAVLADQ
jgi:two-component system cell cycle sensor histidine kinase/response regulator CckA